LVLPQMAGTATHVRIGASSTSGEGDMKGRLSLREFEGTDVCVALADGSRIDGCQLVSAGRGGNNTVWLYVNGFDAFIARSDIVAVWEAPRPDARRAA
jgi:hypothetical protein